jgi:hypothetical protein
MPEYLSYYFNLVLYYLKLIKRDLRLIFLFLKAQRQLKSFDEEKENVRVSDMFKTLVKKHPNKACIIFNEQIWTFKDVI